MTITKSYSDSLILIWRLAEYEARQLQAANIEPVHLLLGLSKSVDLDLPGLIATETPNRDDLLEEYLRDFRQLRNVYHTAKINAAAFRRRLRESLRERCLSLLPSCHLHRTDAAREVFAQAENFSHLGWRGVCPIHLLCAVLVVPDQRRDQVMEDLGIQRHDFWLAAKTELFLKCDNIGDNPARWN